MDRSRLSNIVSATRLLPHFTPHNIDTIKYCIFEQLNCKNESDFLCKALILLYKTLSIESTSIIKNTALKIADSQQITSDQNKNTCNLNTNAILTTTKATNNSKNHDRVTVYKYIQQQYNDSLSRLHSDIIDYLATFLSKQESIEFGYLNKQLFIETQKQSYLLKRQNDAWFEMTDDKVKKLISSKTEGFNYWFSRQMSVSLYKRFDVSKMPCFNNFFRRLSGLFCYDFLSLSYIPVDLLLNNTSNVYQTSTARNSIDTLTITRRIPNILQESVDAVNLFCDELEKYKSRCLSARNINEFLLDSSYVSGDSEQTMTVNKQITKRLLMTCGNISLSIYLTDATSTTVESLQELKTIFHDNLSHFHFSRIEFNLKPNIRHDQMLSQPSKKEYTQLKTVETVGNLKGIGIIASMSHNSLIGDSLDCFDMFSMRNNVESYTIEWQPDRCMHYDEYDVSYSSLCKILFHDYDKHPLLKRVKISFIDDCNLTCFARLLSFFNMNYNELFIERKVDLKYFEKIEVIVEDIAKNSLIERYPIDMDGFYAPNDDMKTIFEQKSDKEYSVDQTTIEIKHVKGNIESFGVVYQNVIRWVQARQAQFEPQYYQDVVRNSRIVFPMNDII